MFPPHALSAAALSPLLLLLLLAPDATSGWSDGNTTARSGLRAWVDPATPDDRRSYTSSRGETWELVMSDEFNAPNRSFAPGDDHLWTAIELPDGVNAALQYYAREQAKTVCDESDGTCFFEIEVLAEPRKTKVWNQHKDPPGMQEVTMYYQSAMVQSWNKFCFQGGAIDMRVQLPGAIGKNSKNPDLQGSSGAAKRVSEAAFYPTWPGIWMMGNLGRALFRESTNRMWPFSYNRCEPSVFDPANQRISACEKEPGFGLNPEQGRGAPEIDIIEGAAKEISSSLQVAPGMPDKFRIMYGENAYCAYTSNCTALGANNIGVPTATYAKRKYKSWYQGLRYAANNLCGRLEDETQSYETVAAALDAGITENKCDLSICPASFDVNGDRGPIDGKKKSSARWGINSNGTCFPLFNVYTGTLLCNEGSTDAECLGGNPKPSVALAKGKAAFKYRMDAISSNWPVHVGVYTNFLTYQLEWVLGDKGYLRWMLDGQPLFEVPAEALTTPPQDADKSNPRKLMPEEPMYLIMNVALSSSWSAKPPNPGRACRDHGNSTSAKVAKMNELICDQFPMTMKVDYIRIYQDVSEGSTMSVGCDPATHPTAKWIDGHIKEYADEGNPWIPVAGGGFCREDADCTIEKEKTGRCGGGRCICTNKAWAGPRCTEPASASRGGKNKTNGGGKTTAKSGYATEVTLAGVGLVLVLVIAVTIYYGKRSPGCLPCRRNLGRGGATAEPEVRVATTSPSVLNGGAASQGPHSGSRRTPHSTRTPHATPARPSALTPATSRGVEHL